MRIYVDVFKEWAGISAEEAREVVKRWVLGRSDTPKDTIPFDEDNVSWNLLLMKNMIRPKTGSYPLDEPFPKSLKQVGAIRIHGGGSTHFRFPLNSGY